MSENTQQNVEMKTINLFGKTFIESSLTDNGRRLMNDINIVEQERRRAEVLLNIIRSSQEHLVQQLQRESELFEEVEMTVRKKEPKQEVKPEAKPE